jgi:hypothetical protein
VQAFAEDWTAELIDATAARDPKNLELSSEPGVGEMA